jgi:hypothetical protein
MTREQELEDRIRQLEAEVRKLSDENQELKAALIKTGLEILAIAPNLTWKQPLATLEEALRPQVSTP